MDDNIWTSIKGTFTFPSEFINILKELINKHGKEVIFDSKIFKSFLSDYTRGEFTRESRLIILALEAGVQNAIYNSDHFSLSKKQQIKLLQDDYFLKEEIAIEVVNTLTLVIKTDASTISKFNELKSNGIKFSNNGDWDNAINQFDEALRIFPNGDIYFRRAQMYIKKSLYDDAVNDINMAIESDGNNCFYYFLRAQAYAYKKNYKLAIKDFTEALNNGLANSSNIGYKARGKVFFENNQYDKAILDYTDAIKFMPDFEAYNGRGDAYFAIKQYEKAIDDFSEAINQEPDQASVYHHRGLAYIHSGQYLLAINDFNETEKFLPNFAENYAMRGSAYKKLGEIDLAINDFEKALSIKSDIYGVEKILKESLELRKTNSAIQVLDTGIQYLNSNDIDKAIKQFDRAIELTQNDNDTPYFFRGNAYFQKGQYHFAINDFTDALRLDPDSSTTFLWRGKAYYHENQYDNAINDFSNTLRLDPNATESYFWRGMAYFKEEQYDFVISDLTKSIENDPHNLASYMARSQAYYMKNQYDAAIYDCNEAIKLEPNEAESYGLRALAYNQLGNVNQAIQDFEKVLKINPAHELARQELHKIRSKGINRDISVGRSIIVAPVAGTVIRYVAREGAVVKSGDVVLIIESMKMELEIKTTSAGNVHFLVPTGAQVGSQQPIAELGNFQNVVLKESLSPINYQTPKGQNKSSYCSQCGKELDPGSRFCGYCGAKI